MDADYKLYTDEIPYNTLIMWSNKLFYDTKWGFEGWTGYPKEPYRHWANYPSLTEPTVSAIWECIKPALVEDGLNLVPHKVVLNLYNHGDSSWLHRDGDNPNDWTVILFLNEHWDVNWGGDFALVKDRRILQAFSAVPGDFVVFRANILHGARPVSREAPYPRFGIAFQCTNDSNLSGLSELKISALRATL
jgi:hypothetical protein